MGGNYSRRDSTIQVVVKILIYSITFPHEDFPSKLFVIFQVEGFPGQPGLILYCAGQATEKDEATVKWAKEKLIAVDPIKRCFSYEVVDSNMGFKSYVATIQVVIKNDQGCVIEWSFACDPVEGWRVEDWRSYLEATIQGMAKKIEDALLS